MSFNEYGYDKRNEYKADWNCCAEKKGDEHFILAEDGHYCYDHMHQCCVGTPGGCRPMNGKNTERPKKSSVFSQSSSIGGRSVPVTPATIQVLAAARRVKAQDDARQTKAAGEREISSSASGSKGKEKETPSVSGTKRPKSDSPNSGSGTPGKSGSKHKDKQPRKD